MKIFRLRKSLLWPIKFFLFLHFFPPFLFFFHSILTDSFYNQIFIHPTIYFSSFFFSIHFHLFLFFHSRNDLTYTIKSYKFFISILDNLLLILKSLHSTFASWLYTTLYLPFHLLTSSTLPSSSSSSSFSSSIHSSLSISLFLYLSFQCLIFSIPNHYLFHFLPLLLLLLLFQ